MHSPPRLSVNQFMVADLSLRELAEWCTRNGVSGIGVLRGTVQRLGASKVAAVLAAHSVVPTSVCVVLGLIDADPARQRERIADAMAAVEDAARLDVPLVVVVGGPMPGLPLARARQQAHEAVAQLAGYADRRGARLLLEPLHPSAVHLSAFTSLREAAECAAGLPAVGLVLDTWHLWTDRDLYADIERDGKLLDVVHVADVPAKPASDERAVPGNGLIDLVGIARQVLATGFAGWWEIEVLCTRPHRRYRPHELLDRSLAGLRQVLIAAGAGARQPQELVMEGRPNANRGHRPARLR
jgi:sugar phosphate isomerase/epimerase